VSSSSRKTPGGKGDLPRGNSSDYKKGYDKIDWGRDHCPLCGTEKIKIEHFGVCCPKCTLVD